MGSIHSQLVQTEQSVGTDVVIVMSESSSMIAFHHWLPSTIRILDNALLESNIGTDPLVPNRYALVGFGRSALPNGSDIFTRPHAFTVDGEKVVNADKFTVLARQLYASGNVQDGYLAIEYALKSLTDDNGENLLRIGDPGVIINVILITDKDRSVLTPYGSSITRSRVTRTINKAGALLNVVVDQAFYAGNDRAFGYDSTRTAYVAGQFGEYRTTTTNARLGVAFGGTTRDYTNVALESGGAAWDMRILQLGGALGHSFARAVSKVQSRKVMRYTVGCRRCFCLDLFGRVSRLICRYATDQERCKRDYQAGIVDTG